MHTAKLPEGETPDLQGEAFQGDQPREPFIIKPSVGRVVWFTPADDTTSAAEDDGKQPFAGIVAYVHNDRLVNLVTFDHNGKAKPQTSVPLVQEGDEKPAGGFYAEWMPYQLGQAKKHA